MANALRDGREVYIVLLRRWARVSVFGQAVTRLLLVMLGSGARDGFGLRRGRLRVSHRLAHGEVRG